MFLTNVASYTDNQNQTISDCFEIFKIQLISYFCLPVFHGNMTEDQNQYNFDSSHIVRLIIEKKIPLIIITVIAIIVSSVVSFLITDKYKSTLILYPASSTSISNSLLNDKVTEKEIMNFGDEEEVEQLLQILHSYEIRDRIIDKYHLMEHYKIDPNSRYPRTELFEEYESNISFEKTEFMSIEVEVLDENPYMAADIANDMASLVDTIVNKMQKDRARKALEIVENEYFGLKERIKTMEDSLTEIRKKGVIYYESQAEVLNDAYAQAILKGQKDRIIELEGKLKILAEYGGAYVSLRDLLLEETEKISNLELKYREAIVDAEQQLPHVYIVNKAEVSEKKAYPIRWLIVLLSSMGAFVLALFILLFTEGSKKKTSGAP